VVFCWPRQSLFESRCMPSLNLQTRGVDTLVLRVASTMPVVNSVLPEAQLCSNGSVVAFRTERQLSGRLAPKLREFFEDRVQSELCYSSSRAHNFLRSSWSTQARLRFNMQAFSAPSPWASQAKTSVREPFFPCRALMSQALCAKFMLAPVHRRAITILSTGRSSTIRLQLSTQEPFKHCSVASRILRCEGWQRLPYAWPFSTKLS
jgi:hypothetical protein